jgi:protein-tyrosine phosphatase
VGVSRSATILIAFLMREYNMRFKEALKFVTKKRIYVSPNEGFIKELETYEKQLFG